jgi:hypothetical protein
MNSAPRTARSNTLLDLTNTDAAHNVLRPLCLLSVFAAQQHVRWAEAASTSIGINFKEHLSVKCSG